MRYPVRVMAIYLIICWVGQRFAWVFLIRCYLLNNFLANSILTPGVRLGCQQRAVVTTHGVLLGKKHIEQADGSREGCCGSGWVEHGVTWKRSVWGASRDRDPVTLGYLTSPSSHNETQNPYPTLDRQQRPQAKKSKVGEGWRWGFRGPRPEKAPVRECRFLSQSMEEGRQDTPDWRCVTSFSPCSLPRT